MLDSDINTQLIFLLGSDIDSHMLGSDIETLAGLRYRDSCWTQTLILMLASDIDIPLILLLSPDTNVD